jgi:hypothetical protein
MPVLPILQYVFTYHLNKNKYNMKIYNLDVTSNFFEQVDDSGCHIELDGCIRFVYLRDTDYSTMDELKQAIEGLYD